MSENERIVCEFLRKIAPSRNWEYLGEIEHYWIGELCDELNEHLKAENAKLRELARGLDYCTTWANEDGKDCWSCPLWHEKDCTAEDIERELGIEVDE